LVENKFKKLPWQQPAPVKIKKVSDDYPFYNSHRWRQYSLARRKRHPNCVCELCISSDDPLDGTMTDHIIPIRIGGSKFDERNLQTMNKLKCHQVKRQRERQGLYEEYTFNELGEKISSRKFNEGVRGSDSYS